LSFMTKCGSGVRRGMASSATGRKLECGQCGASYRSTYRGRRPLCWSCQRQRAKENNLQMSSSPSTSFTNLPNDVLCSLVPYLLKGRSARDLMPESYSWARSAHPNQDRPPQVGQLPPHVGELVYVFENAVVPTLRIKLVCKALNSAVNEHMDSILHPREVCVQAAAKIQQAVIIRGYVFRHHQRALYQLAAEWSDDDALIADEWLDRVTEREKDPYSYPYVLAIYPASTYERRREMSDFIRIGMMVMQACHSNNGSLS